MSKQEFYFSSANQKAGTLAVEWLPKGEPKAVLHIWCDSAEHMQCGEELAGIFTLHGFVVAACNHLVQEELHHCLQVVKRKYADVPHLLLGCFQSAAAVHSFISKNPEAVEGAILVADCQGTVLTDEKLPVLQIPSVAEHREETYRQIYGWAEERLDEMLYRAATKH